MLGMTGFRRLLATVMCLLLLTSCQGSRRKSAPPAAPSAEAADIKTLYDPVYDDDFRAIFEDANKDRWDEAYRRTQLLKQKDPYDGSVERLASWVESQRKLFREQNLEDSIRAVEAKNSVFNPTVPSLLKEEKDRGLPPRKDLRDAVEQIENTPYIPPSYGKTIRQQGPLFSTESADGRMSRILDQEITVQLDDLTLEDIIFHIGRSEGINFVADKSLPAFQKKLSVNMERVALREFLHYISRNLGIQFQIGGDLIWVVDGSDPKNKREETHFYRLREGFIMPAVFGASEVDRTEINVKGITTTTEKSVVSRFVNDGAAATPSIAQAIEEFFTGSKYMIDYERNLIVAQGTPEELAGIERIIEEFDRPIQQVLIEARFITVTQGAFLQLGAAWETGRSGPTGQTPVDFTGLGAEINPSLGLQETFTNILGRANLSATLTALEQSGESHTLSAPRITLLNNLPARISDGKVQYYYEEYTVQQDVTEQRSVSSLVPEGKPAKVTSGVQLDVIASIAGDGQSIMLGLRPKVNQDVKLVTFATVTDVDSSGRVISTFDIKLPESRTQEMATRVIVKSGETVMMGGVLEREQTSFVESVPGLGNIPIIGVFFRKRTEIDKPRYLLVFVTATIIAPSGEFIVYEDTPLLP